MKKKALRKSGIRFFSGKGGDHRFKVLNGGGENVLKSSAGYPSDWGLKRAMKAMAKSNIVVFARKGKHYFHYKAKNGKIISCSVKGHITEKKAIVAAEQGLKYLRGFWASCDLVDSVKILIKKS